jgi:predicted DNA-binding transcriptional regulator AlpA
MRRSGGRTIDEIRARIRDEAEARGYGSGARSVRASPRPRIPGPIRVHRPHGRLAKKYLTLAELAEFFGFSIPETVRLVKRGALPWPIRDGRDAKHRRWSLLAVNTLRAWQKSRASLSKQKFRVQAASTDADLSETCGKVLPFKRPL